MTARRGTLEAAAAQRQVIEALRSTGDTYVADRFLRCMEAMTSRRNGGGYPWTCRSPGCAWCGRTRARRWWAGMRRWIVNGGAPVSLAVLPLHHPSDGLRAAVARLRRAVRDVRDRAARRRGTWKGVALAGLATGNGSAFVFVSHPGIGRSEVVDIFRKRWPAAILQNVGAAEPSWSMSTEDATELARIRRGAEPLRIVVLPQRAADPAERCAEGTGDAARWLEPMPIVL